MTCIRVLLGGLALMSQAAQAGSGLVPPAGDTVWPALQARISLQTTTAAHVGLTDAARLAAPPQPGVAGMQGGAVFGDYYFARQSFGAFRATSGLMMGASSGAPLWSATQGGRLGLAVTGSAWPGPLSADAMNAQPYLGLGFSSPPGAAGWSLSADLGLVADGGAGSLRRAFGVQGLDTMRRELRLSPVLQVDWRYSF